MATTENLGIEKIDPSDFVSPDPINNAFDKLDALGKDYVIDQGVSGEWRYRRWHSGVAECWIPNKNFGSDTLEPWGAIYATMTGRSFGAYPFTFAEAPCVIVSPGNTQGSGGLYLGITTKVSSDYLTRSPQFDTWRATSGTIDKVVMSIYAIGTFKAWS